MVISTQHQILLPSTLPARNIGTRSHYQACKTSTAVGYDRLFRVYFHALRDWFSVDFGLGRNDVLPTHSVFKEADIDVHILSHLERRVLRNDYVDTEELRDVLRRAAALLCRTKDDQCSIIQHLVGIPFIVFTKQSIKLGIALWLGVINENPRMEPRILAEIAQCWENTVRRQVGVFSDRLRYVPDSL